MSYFSEEQTEALLRITAKYIAGYNLDETHGEDFRAWCAEDDFMGVGKQFEIPLGLYGEGVYIFSDDEEIYFKVDNREAISSRRFAQRWKDAHEKLIPIAEAVDKAVKPSELEMTPTDYGPEIRIGQIWTYKNKTTSPDFEVLGGETKHISLKNLDTGKTKPMQDKFINTEYRLVQDNPEGEVVSYKMIISDDPVDAMSPEDLEKCIDKQ